MERISKKSARSTANIENGKIKIIKRIGKWSGIDAHDYLQPHEALFLMEIVSSNQTVFKYLKITTKRKTQ